MRFGLALAMIALGSGCAVVLGFDETTLRPDEADGAAPLPDGGDAPSDASGDAAGTHMSVEPRALVVRRGASADVIVTLDPPPAAPLVLSARDLPPGVTAAPVDVAAGAGTAVVTFAASASTPFGSSTATLSADAPGVATARLPLLVAGPTGTPDPTFDADGYVLDATKGTGATFRAIARDADGRVVAVGAGGGWLARRFGPNGAADAAFTTALGVLPTDGEARAVAVDPTSSKIVIAGTSSAGGIGVTQLTVMRRLPTGAADTSFAGGVFRLSVGDAALGSTAVGVAIAADGSVVVAGFRNEIGGKSTGLLLRLKSDGTRDPAFAEGKAVTFADRPLVGVALDPAGSIVAGGSDASSALGSFFLTKRSADGKPFATFGTAGEATLGLGFRARGFAEAADGSLVLAGESAQSGNVYTLGRADAAGAQVFARGIATGAGAGLSGVATDNLGRIVVAGNTVGVGAEARVARVLADGALDATFGKSGAALVDATALSSVAVEPDGRILVAGGRAAAGAVVVRLWP